MRCPIDADTDLQMADRQGIEIDYCPKCRGVWLDRGELDKLIERAAGIETARAERAPMPPRTHDRRDFDDDDDDRRYGDDYRKRRRKSLLGELFDF